MYFILLIWLYFSRRYCFYFYKFPTRLMQPTWILKTELFSLASRFQQFFILLYFFFYISFVFFIPDTHFSIKVINKIVCLIDFTGDLELSIVTWLKTWRMYLLFSLTGNKLSAYLFNLFLCLFPCLWHADRQNPFINSKLFCTAIQYCFYVWGTICILNS